MSTPEDEHVRRLLADLAHTDAVAPAPVPPEVAARLESTLAGLRDEAAPEEPAREQPARVLSWRRRLTPYLAAAAAVVVVAGGGAAVLTSGGDPTAGGGGSGESDSSAAESDGAGSTGSASSPTPAREDPASPGRQEPGDGSSLDTGTQRVTRAPALSRASFTADAAQLLAARELAVPDRAALARTDGALRRVEASGCLVPDRPDGAVTFVVLDGDPAVLQVGPVTGGRRTVTALACADGATIARTQVSAQVAAQVPGGERGR